MCSKLALFITGQNSTGTFRALVSRFKNDIGHLKELLLLKETINPMHIIQQMTDLAGQIWLKVKLSL